MADLSDVTAYITTLVAAAVYPNGFSSPSIAPIPTSTSGATPSSPSISQVFTAPMDVRIYEGWPVSDQLDLDLGGKVEVPNVSTSPTSTNTIARANGPCVNVSIFPLAGTGNAIYQIQNHTHIITPPAINLTVTVGGEPGSPAEPTQVTVTGTPATGEYVTVVADRQFIYSETGATATAILEALLADAQVNYPTASLNGNTLTIPSFYSFVARQGGVAVLGKVLKRQCQYVMISIWAPDHNSRSVISSAIDIALKENIIIKIPVDNSDVRIVYNRTNVIDQKQDITLYRRDLVYEVDYATVEEFPGYVITSSTITLAAGEYEFPTPPANVNFIS